MGIVFESSVTVHDQYMTSNSVLVLTVLHGAIPDTCVVGRVVAELRG